MKYGSVSIHSSLGFPHEMDYHKKYETPCLVNLIQISEILLYIYKIYKKKIEKNK